MNPLSFRSRALLFTLSVAFLCFLSSIQWTTFVSEPERKNLSSPSTESADSAQIPPSDPAPIATNAPAPSPSPTPAHSPAITSSLPPKENAPRNTAFRTWLKTYQEASPDERRSMIAEGIALAQERRSVMSALIRSNPERALAESLHFSEWQALPEEIQPLTEKPFSTVANYTLFPICPGTGNSQKSQNKAPTQPPIEIRLANGESLQAFVYGNKAAINSKRGLPIQGIALEGQAALWDGIFLPLNSEDSAMAKKTFPPGQRDDTLSFATGKPAGDAPVSALSGGKRFTFASMEELTALSTALAKLDAKPGPRPASRTIFSMPYSDSAINTDADAFNFSAAEIQATLDADAWTKGEKKVFLIRATFPDKRDDPVSQADASTVINGTLNGTTASSAIYQMSYKTAFVTATVSANTYELPLSSGSYTGTVPSDPFGANFSSNTSKLLEDARATFRTSRSGLDATINIGTAAAVGVAGGDLGDYDVVGVTFTDIGCYGNGFKIAGLASVGGGDLWMQGSNDPKVYVHELGHVYGLLHSNFWETNDGSVVGSGTEKEYGDPYDVMGSGTLPKGHFHPQAKQKLGWLKNNQWQDATAQGSNIYRVYQHDDPLTTGAIRGLRVTKASSPEEFYWIGYRGTRTDNPHLFQGAYMLWQRPQAIAADQKCCLIDTTPDTHSDKTDAGLDIGRTYSDTSAQVHITPVGRGGSGSNQFLDIQINLGTLTSSSDTIIGSISGLSTVPARTVATFSVNAQNTKNNALAYFWKAGDGAISGGTASGDSTFSHAWTTAGTYTVSVTASDMKGGSVSASTTVTVTDPARQFTSRNSGTKGDINAIAASPTLLVAVGQNEAPLSGNIIRTSTDGVSWTERSIPESTLNLCLNSIVWDGTRFVAVGRDYDEGIGWYGVIYISETGFQWSRTLATLAVLNAVCCGNGYLLAVGDSGTVLRSSDAKAWTNITGIPFISPNAMSCRGVAYGNGIFAITARTDSLISGGGVLCTSSDNGNTWSDQTSGADLISGQDLEKIAFLNGKFFTSGWMSTLKTAVPNAGTLTFSSSLSGSQEAFVLAYSPGLYFASGVSRIQTGTQTTSTPANYYSTDGITWVQADSQTGMSAQKDGVFFNNSLVSVGSSGAIWQSAPLGPSSNHAPVIDSVVTQSTLNARSPITLVVNASDVDGDSLTYLWDAGETTINNTSKVFTHTWTSGGLKTVKLTINDGHGGSVSTTQSLSVVDPAGDFIKRTSNTAENLHTITSNGSVAVAAGSHGVVLTSTDGVVWTNRTVTPSANLYFYDVTWDGSKFVLVGMNYINGSFVGTIYSSQNGSTWINEYNLGTQKSALRSVVGTNGTLFAGGDQGTLLRSVSSISNGTWAPVTNLTLSGTSSVTALAYGEGKFLAASHTYVWGGAASGNPFLYSSSNGASWTNLSQGLGIDSWMDIGRIAYLNDRFVASGWYSKLRVSTDAATTFQTTRPAFEKTPALAYGNGVYFAAGVDQSAADAKVHLVSADGISWDSTGAPGGVSVENGATFFRNTFIVVGNDGHIWQSGTVSTNPQGLEILQHPTPLSVNEGDPFTLSVVAIGGGTLSYQWKKNDVNVSGGTSASLTITQSALLDSGSYSVLISDSGSSSGIESHKASVTINRTPVPGDSIVSGQPPSNVALIRGSDAFLDISLTNANGLLNTSYTLFSGSNHSSASATTVTGTITSGSTVSVPLRSIGTEGSYFLRFVRTLTSGAQTTEDSQNFVIAFKGWDAAAGSYETLIALDAASTSALNDNSIYRGLVTLTITRSGAVSGKICYNEAPLLQLGTSGERICAPITRSFAGRFAPKPGVPSVMQLTPKLGTTAQAARESLTIECDMNQAIPSVNATLQDYVSIKGGTCTSASTNVTKAVVKLPLELTFLAGKYLLSTVTNDPSVGYEPQAYIQTQVTSLGRVLWNTRLPGYFGTGSALLNTSNPAQPAVQIYEAAQTIGSTFQTATSLMGVLNFNPAGLSRWYPSVGSINLPDKLEKQASYVKRALYLGTLTPIYDASNFANGTNWTGVKYVSFSQENTAKWSSSTNGAIPDYIPTQPVALNLDITDPQTTDTRIAYRWTVTVGSSGLVITQPKLASNNLLSPPLSLRLDRNTGLWQGIYSRSGSRRSLIGASIDSGITGTKKAQGWAESGTLPNMKTGTWTLTK